MMPALLSIGDVITMRGVCADGAIDGTKPAKQWRVARIDDPLEVVLQPLNADGSIDEFSDACGDYRLTVQQVTANTMH